MLHIVGPLFRVCFKQIENVILINHLGHILFGKVRVFKVLPSVMKINSLFLYVAIVRPMALVLCFLDKCAISVVGFLGTEVFVGGVFK